LDRQAAGRRLRQQVPRSSHGPWSLRADRDPVAILEASNHDRLPDLVPLRYSRMLANPFCFLRGAAALMAHDLATTASSGLVVQVCGDCHVLNFGLFATPERQLVFDVNDFDETLPGPWEWDLKRLVASLVVAGRENGHGDGDNRRAVHSCVAVYQERLAVLAGRSPTEVWYSRLTMDDLIAHAPSAHGRRLRKAYARAARRQVIDHQVPWLARQDDGTLRFVERPPTLFRSELQGEEPARVLIEGYRASLPPERVVLFDRYRLLDHVIKVVGIGSVGTRCFIALFGSDSGQSLILQVKEARRSVLEPFTTVSAFGHQGERVVTGQRLMQSSSDIFLGWCRGRNGRDYYVRQLRDMKFSFPVEGCSANQLLRYGESCGWTLARAHAKSGDAAAISGYLGKGPAMAEALAGFALGYADQTAFDHQALVAAAGAGRIPVYPEATPTSPAAGQSDGPAPDPGRKGRRNRGW
jgi:uncharacterized protein (DUF2252 family)